MLDAGYLILDIGLRVLEDWGVRCKAQGIGFSAFGTGHSRNGKDDESRQDSNTESRAPNAECP
jgi:hypothetical protein